MARQVGHGSRPRGRLLGGGIRAPGLPAPESGRLHLPFRTDALEAAEACGFYQGIEQHNRPIDRALSAQYVYSPQDEYGVTGGLLVRFLFRASAGNHMVKKICYREATDRPITEEILQCAGRSARLTREAFN